MGPEAVIHLDTSYIVDLLREAARGSEGPTSRFLWRVQDQELRMSVFVACEFAAGAAMAAKPTEEKRKVERLCSGLSIDYPDENFPAAYGSLVAALERGVGRVVTMDLLIATSALIAEASLVTRNSKDFARVPGLDLLEY